MQMLDFLLGLFLIDIGGDDGEGLGLWPWERETGIEPSPAAEEIRATLFGDADWNWSEEPVRRGADFR